MKHPIPLQVVKLLQGMQEQLESEVGTVVVIECALNLSQQFIQKCILSIYDMYCVYIYICTFLYLHQKSIPVSTIRVVKFLGSQETVKAYIPTSLGTALAQGPWLVNFMY